MKRTDTERLGSRLEERVGGLLRGLGLAGGLGDFLGGGLNKRNRGLDEINGGKEKRRGAHLYIVKSRTG